MSVSLKAQTKQDYCFASVKFSLEKIVELLAVCNDSFEMPISKDAFDIQKRGGVFVWMRVAVSYQSLLIGVLALCGVVAKRKYSTRLSTFSLSVLLVSA